MRLPNKLYTYEQSTLSKLSTVLEAMNEGIFTVSDLWQAAAKDFADVDEFLEALSTLYALRAIRLTDERKVVFDAA